MASNMQRFFGGSPGAVIVMLIFLSLLVGAFMAFLGLSPGALLGGLIDSIRSVFDLSFEAVLELGRWVLTGAVIVVPIWLLSRLFAGR